MSRRFTAYAPPIVWGLWTTIENHSGSISFKISYSPNGDTMIMGKVRYCKEIGKLTEEEFKDEITIKTANAYANIDVCFKGIPLGSAVEGEIQ